jgi:hypothetical protein
MALIEDALLVCRGRRVAGVDNGRQDRVRAEAQAWIDSDDTAYPFSFANACQILGLNCQAVRRAVPGQRSQAHLNRVR